MKSDEQQLVYRTVYSGRDRSKTNPSTDPLGLPLYPKWNQNILSWKGPTKTIESNSCTLVFFFLSVGIMKVLDMAEV